MSELGNLSQCMVDSDVTSKSGAKRRRRKALAVSIALEIVAIGGLVLWPLLTVAVLPSQAVVTPLPPYRGPQEPPPVSHPGGHGDPHRPDFGVHPVFLPPSIPPRVDIGPGSEPPSIGDVGGPAGPGVPGGFEGGTQIEIVAPPRSHPQTKIVERSEGVMQAMLVHRIDPIYPPLARTIRLSGTVILRATIATDGDVRNVEVLSGNALLAQAARAAVMQWRYRPTMLNGQPVEVETQITVNFILN